MSHEEARAMVRAMLSRSESELLAMVGGVARTGDGYTLDVRLQMLEAQSRAQQAPDPLQVELMRAASAQGVSLLDGDPEPGVTWRTQQIDGPRGPIALRIYQPEAQDARRPPFLFMHYGGGVIGDLETCHWFCTVLAKETGTVIVSVDYRLAPEHRFPAGLEDCLAAYDWTNTHSAALGAATRPPAIGGDSMGGNFTAVIAQEMRRRGQPQPTLQAMIYPATDITDTSPSMSSMSDAFPLTAKIMAWFMENYVEAGTDLSDLRLSPAHAPSLSGLAPAYIYTAGFDPLRDQGEKYAQALQAAGVAVKYHCFGGLCHAFTSMTGPVPAADAACRQIARDLAAGLA
jgi:acetyl esterase/lipase